MRKIVVSMFVSLDGVIEDPGGSEKSEHGGWTFPFWDDSIGQVMFDTLFASDAMLLGRVTYEGFAAAWPSQNDAQGFADKMNNIPKYVVSTTLENPAWNNTQVVNENVIEKISRLKEQDGKNILINGSGYLINSLIPHGLIDEYQLLIYPVVLGSGKRLFREGNYTGLKLVETKTFDTGVVLLRYQRAEPQAAAS
jgi:dihydrofolate reductase